MTARSYGYIPDAVDERDHKFSAALPDAAAAPLPWRLDLTGNHNYPDAYDQAQYGSCAGNAVAFGVAHAVHVPHALDPYLMLSRLEIYYLARAMRGWEGEDGGCQIRDAIKVVAKQGVAEEALWPYTAEHLFSAPTPDVLTASAAHEAVQYSRIDTPTVDAIKAALYTGHPVIFGILVYPAFESEEVARTGLVPMPQDGEQTLGGHAMVVVGYDDHRQLFKTRNSWGPQHGDNGHVWLPYGYLANLKYAQDFWVIQRTTPGATP